MNDKDYMKEDWFAVLKEEVEKNGTAKTAAKKTKPPFQTA